jgi:hypothetical protein
MKRLAETPAFLFLGRFPCSGSLARGGDVAAEEAKFTGGGAGFAEGGVEMSGSFRFGIDKKLIFPRMAVDGAAFDLEKIDAVFGEGFEKGKESTGAVRQAHGERNFAGILGNPGCRFILRKKKHKTSEILGVVLDALGENHGVVMLGGAARGDGGTGFVAPSKHFADTARCIFRGDALPLRMGGEETLALSESHRMRGDRANIGERRTRDGNELHLDGQNGFRNNRQPALQQQIENTDNGASQGILDGREESVGGAFRGGAKGGLKCGARDGRDGVTQKLNGGGFAEGAGLALKGYAQVLAIGWNHGQALSCNKGRKTRSGD